MTTTTPRAEPMSNACNYGAGVHPQPSSTAVDDTSCLPPRALYTAQVLIGAVRDDSAGDVSRILSRLDRQQLLDLTVTLAALVPYDQSLRDLLAWNDEQWQVHGRKVRRLRPHGTHAGYARHKKRDEPVCDDCTEGERAYQRARAERRRHG